MVDPSKREATPAEARAVIDDWYDDGTFDTRHTCASIRAAIKLLPQSPRVHATVRKDMEAVVRRACF